MFWFTSIRCQLIGFLLLAVLVGCIRRSFGQSVDAERMNIVLILADDLGFGDCGFTGSRQIKTPHIDALAQSGIVCEQGYVSAPVCAPSRAGLLTGRNQPTFGFDNNLPPSPLQQFNPQHSGLPLNVRTVADYLGDLGYVSGIIGKWHLGEAEPFHPLNRGFDEFWGYLGGGHDYFKSKPDSRQSYLRPIICSYKEPGAISYLTDDKGSECVDFIRRHKHERFFLYASFNAPHGPLQATQEDLELYKDIENLPRRTYCAMVHRLDVNVGRIMDELKRQGLEEKTLVVFLSDNGGPIRTTRAGTVAGIRSNAPFRGSKGILLEGGIHVPFIVSLPGKLPANQSYPTPVSSLDLVPTFLEIAGFGKSEKLQFDGVNLVPFLESGEPVERKATLKWRFTISACIRDGNWKLIRLPDRLPMLFDLDKDQSETTNLAAGNPKLVSDMLRELGEWDVSCPHPQFLEGDRYRRDQLRLYDVEYNLDQPQ